MSIEIMTNAWKHRPRLVRGTELVVLLALADHANDDGLCFPSMRKLAYKCGCTLRQAQRLIGSLVERNIIAVELQGGRGGVNLFRFRPMKEWIGVVGLAGDDVGVRDDVGVMGDDTDVMGDDAGVMGEDVSSTPEPEGGVTPMSSRTVSNATTTETELTTPKPHSPLGEGATRPRKKTTRQRKTNRPSGGNGKQRLLSAYELTVYEILAVDAATATGGYHGRVKRVAATLETQGWSVDQLKRFYGQGGRWYMTFASKDHQPPRYPEMILNSVRQLAIGERGDTAQNGMTDWSDPGVWEKADEYTRLKGATDDG